MPLDTSARNVRAVPLPALALTTENLAKGEIVPGPVWCFMGVPTTPVSSRPAHRAFNPSWLAGGALPTAACPNVLGSRERSLGPQRDCARPVWLQCQRGPENARLVVHCEPDGDPCSKRCGGRSAGPRTSRHIRFRAS